MSSLVTASRPLCLYSSHDILLSPSHTSSPFLPLGFTSSFLEFSFYRKEFSDHLSSRSDLGPLHFSYHLSLPPSQTLSLCILTVWVISVCTLKAVNFEFQFLKYSFVGNISFEFSFSVGIEHYYHYYFKGISFRWTLLFFNVFCCCFCNSKVIVINILWALTQKEQ